MTAETMTRTTVGKWRTTQVTDAAPEVAKMLTTEQLRAELERRRSATASARLELQLDRLRQRAEDTRAYLAALVECQRSEFELWPIRRPPTNSRRVDLKGRVIGSWKVLGFAATCVERKQGTAAWACRCRRCGHQRLIGSSHLLHSPPSCVGCQLKAATP